MERVKYELRNDDLRNKNNGVFYFIVFIFFLKELCPELGEY